MIRKLMLLGLMSAVGGTSYVHSMRSFNPRKLLIPGALSAVSLGGFVSYKFLDRSLDDYYFLKHSEQQSAISKYMIATRGHAWLERVLEEKPSKEQNKKILALIQAGAPIDGLDFTILDTLHQVSCKYGTEAVTDDIIQMICPNSAASGHWLIGLFLNSITRHWETETVQKTIHRIKKDVDIDKATGKLSDFCKTQKRNKIEYPELYAAEKYVERRKQAQWILQQLEHRIESDAEKNRKTLSELKQLLQ